MTPEDLKWVLPEAPPPWISDRSDRSTAVVTNTSNCRSSRPGFTGSWTCRGFKWAAALLVPMFLSFEQSGRCIELRCPVDERRNDLRKIFVNRSSWFFPSHPSHLVICVSACFNKLRCLSSSHQLSGCFVFHRPENAHRARLVRFDLLGQVLLRLWIHETARVAQHRRAPLPSGKSHGGSADRLDLLGGVV